MKFKRLSVYGFKSFADKLDVKFGDGITAIVGPNGCGKSNVADAMRWVLGEQSAKTLRGSNMQDVIFNGTQKRKSMSYAEVSLVFDNENMSLFPSCNYREVTFTRKLFRSGESVYYINGEVVRLKNIVAMLRDGGFGREGYTIIGQGRIDELINSKPENRRAIFEEAAGIIKYKARKDEANRRLAAATQNLVRVDDRLEILGNQLRPMTREAEKARKREEYVEKLKFHEINTYICQYESANDIKEQHASALNDFDAQITQKAREHEEAEELYNKTRADLSNLDNKMDDIRTELNNLNLGAVEKNSELTILRDRIKNCENEVNKLLEENDNTTTEFTRRAQSLNGSKDRYDALCRELSLSKNQYDALSDEYNEAVKLVSNTASEMDSARSNMIEAMNKLSDIKANMSRLIAERESTEKHIENIDTRLADNNDRLIANTHLLSNVQAELESMAYEKNNKAIKLDKLNDELITTRDELEKFQNERDILSSELLTLRTRLKTLNEVQSAYSGYMDSVRRLLKDAEKDETLDDKIEGVIGQIITVGEKYETAIETALGSAVSNIVTRNEIDAKLLIDYLKSHEYGRATFLPMTSIKPRSIDSRYMHLLSGSGCFGVASKLIDYDSKYQSVIEGLLGGTAIVDNMDTAIKLARDSNYAFRVVTLDGDIIYPQGSITGGSKKSNTANIFTHEREMKELVARLPDMEKRFNEVSQSASEYAHEVSSLTDEINGKSEELHSLDLVFAGKHEACSKTRETIEQVKHEQEAITQEREFHKKKLDEVVAKINSVGELESMIAVKRTDAESSGHDSRAVLDEVSAKRDSISSQLNDKRMHIMELGKDINSTQEEILREEQFLKTATERINSNKARIDENNNLISQYNARIEVISNQVTGSDSERIKELNEILSNTGKYKVELEKTLNDSDSKRGLLTKEIADLTEAKNEQKISIVQIETNMQAMRERVEEAYHLDYEGCLSFREPDYDMNSGYTEIGKLKNSIERLGTVSSESIKAAQDLYNEYHKKEQEREDILNAKLDIEHIIKELSDEMLTVFNTEFEKIRTNFKSIFVEMFNGGSADLILQENPDDPLQSGIEIVAQPPSKNLQSISLLSGGEKALTAIAILFSILKLKPMPFCVLDEIEAALDEANVGRFASYLKKFSQETQFIVITHRKPTMEEADYLYGVTMQEKGVTKIVSVRLEEAVAQAKVD